MSANKDPQIKKHHILHHFSAKQQSKPTYTIFYASIDPATGKMWCSDCVAVESLLSTIFAINPFGSSAKPLDPYGSAAQDASATEGKPVADIKYVGSREEWKNSTENAFRGPPFELKSVPTILAFRDGKIVARIEEDEILDGTRLEGFLGA